LRTTWLLLLLNKTQVILIQNVQSANSEQKPTSEKINTHENTRDRQFTLVHYEQADIEHKTEFQNIAENNDCMNTGIVHTQ
jgi:hypothetical protein